METESLDKNKTKKNDIAKPIANKTRKRICPKGTMFVASRGECFPTAEAKDILSEEKAEEKLRKATERLELKAKAKALKDDEKAKKEAIKKEEKAKKDAERGKKK